MLWRLPGASCYNPRLMVAQKKGRTRVSLQTLGCKLNQAETEQMARDLVGAGAQLVAPDETADVFILNTCTVTGAADAEARRLLRAARRRNDAAFLVSMGCLVERDAAGLSAVSGPSMVICHEEAGTLVERLRGFGFLREDDINTSLVPDRRARAFLGIQNGCKRICAYCIVPLVRGPEKSTPADEVIVSIKERVAEGYSEVVLTGTEPGAYRDARLDLTGLLNRILDETAVRRLRISSLQPGEITPELLRLWRSRRLCPHFHLALQSGSDDVLRGMLRSYDTARFVASVELIRKMIPNAAITTDIIVGFPGETKEQFAESLAFCRRMSFARLHVFSYSPRPGTPAAGMKGQVPASVKKERSLAMRTLARECAGAFQKGFKGQRLDVLWEQQEGSFWSGYTGNYIRAYTKSSRSLTGEITSARLEDSYRDGVWALLEE